MKITKDHLDIAWQKILSSPLQQKRLTGIESFLESQKDAGKQIYPDYKDIFAALYHTPFQTITVVILWQDPYHGPWQAHGMSFSVPEWVKIPPSLRNIYKELWVQRESGDLTHWAQQWVLLLNAALTVEASKPGSHSQIWWWDYSDEIIRQISQQRDGLVFLLWWAFAAQKKELIDTKKHLILSAPHPSPLSAYRWFFWCEHFQKVNEYLKNHWKNQIKW